MKVSVIIPVKNRANLIAETLDSIVQQELKPYEIIIVDDHSEDALANALLPYKDQVTIVKSKGRGPGAARNTGFEASTGDFIQFFDSDDLMSKNKLSVQALLLSDSKNKGFVYGPYIKAQKVDGAWKNKDVLMQFKPMGTSPFVEYVIRGWCSITQACLFTRELVEEVGPWSEEYHTHEDKEFWYKVGLITDSPLHEAQTCVLYRQHSSQVTDAHISELQKAKNSIMVHEAIKKNLKGGTPWLSKTMLNGYIVNNRRYLNSLSEAEYYKPGLGEQIDYFLYKLMGKYERSKTGSDWQTMHGVTADPEIIKKYLNWF